MTNEEKTYDELELNSLAYLEQLGYTCIPEGAHTENPMNLEAEINRYLHEECSDDDEPGIHEIAEHFAEWGYLRAVEKYNEIEYNRQRAEESVPNDLGEAALSRMRDPDMYLSDAVIDEFGDELLKMAQFGAEWQKEQDLAEMAQSESPLSVAYANRCFENGKQAMKEQMLKDAVEISYKGGTARINGEEKPFEGGTVRVIFLPKEDEK